MFWIVIHMEKISCVFCRALYIHESWIVSKQYGIKLRCYWECLWGTLLGTWWEHIENIKKKNTKTHPSPPLVLYIISWDSKFCCCYCCCGGLKEQNANNIIIIFDKERKKERRCNFYPWTWIMLRIKHIGAKVLGGNRGSGCWIAPQSQLSQP
jgi:hypothetical protein